MDKKFENNKIDSFLILEESHFAFKGSSERGTDPAVRVRIAIRAVEVEVIVVRVDVERVAIGVPIACHYPCIHRRSSLTSRFSGLCTPTSESYRERLSLKADNDKNFLLISPNPAHTIATREQRYSGNNI